MVCCICTQPCVKTTTPRIYCLLATPHRTNPASRRPACSRAVPVFQQCVRQAHRRRRITVRAVDGGDGPSTAYDPAVPSFMTGVNWYCYTALGLLFVADLSPLGLLLKASDNVAGYLALCQWGIFAAPTVVLCQQRSFDLRRTFRLRWCSWEWAGAGAFAGVALWGLLAVAISLKTGTTPTSAGLSTSSELLFGAQAGPGDVGHWVKLLLLVGLSPAGAEELLFRGFLLTALQQRLGRVDAVALTAALFAAIHLSIPGFFPFIVLGAACGGVTLAADSLLPAVVLHAAYNVAVLTQLWVLSSGGDSASAGGTAVAVAGLLGVACGGAAYVLGKEAVEVQRTRRIFEKQGEEDTSTR